MAKAQQTSNYVMAKAYSSASILNCPVMVNGQTAIVLAKHTRNNAIMAIVEFDTIGEIAIVPFPINLVYGVAGDEINVTHGKDGKSLPLPWRGRIKRQMQVGGPITIQNCTGATTLININQIDWANVNSIEGVSIMTKVTEHVKQVVYFQWSCPKCNNTIESTAAPNEQDLVCQGCDEDEYLAQRKAFGVELNALYKEFLGDVKIHGIEPYTFGENWESSLNWLDPKDDRKAKAEELRFTDIQEIIFLREDGKSIHLSADGDFLVLT